MNVLTRFWMVSLSGLLLAVSAYWALQPQTPHQHPARMTVPEMIRHWGYDAEEHTVTTEDGYILALHRIPRGAREKPEEKIGDKRQKKTPVLMYHCLLCSSAVFSFGPPERSLAYLLADAGYDVWMANARGNTWSKGHVALDDCPNCTDYWNFSFDELGRFDIPAEIDYILKSTGHDQLMYVGYSMGSTAYVIAMSERPEYNDKISAAFLMGPAAFMSRSVTPFTPVIHLADDFFHTLESIGIKEMMPNGELFHFFSSQFCTLESLTLEVCARAFSILTGVDEARMDKSLLSMYADHLPAGSNTRTIAHYAQLSWNDGRFCKYDYGSAEENIQAYGQEMPPDYDLSKATARTVMYAGNGDAVADIDDARLLEQAMPNAELIQVEVHGWSHCDFFMSTDVAEVVYNNIIDRMNETVAKSGGDENPAP